MPSNPLTIKPSSEGEHYASRPCHCRSSASDYLAIGYRSDIAGGSFVFTATYPSGGSYQPIDFRTSDSDRLYISTAGNVGIGSTVPGQLLDITGSVNGIVSKG